MSEPVGWNVYYTGRHLDGTEWHRFKEFTPSPAFRARMSAMHCDYRRRQLARRRRRR